MPRVSVPRALISAFKGGSYEQAEVRAFTVQPRHLRVGRRLVDGGRRLRGSTVSRAIDAYIGLWEGVDALDGSVVRLSLSDVNDDGIIELTQTETFYSFCHSLGANFSLGHGVEVGTATWRRRGTR